MENAEDIRWRQRLANFSKALQQLTEFVEKPELNKFEKQGLIQCFEYTFELAWKTMKDYLEDQGFMVRSPRMAIQTGFQMQLVSDGHVWLDALEKRNLMAHTYDEGLADEAERLIREHYFGMLRELYEYLEGAK
ncbi:nucleotidyltransferase substrate binding protein, HI0074 family [Acididesulfobacillus acetoxydans]|uniref:Nucleotidyltransferase substrate binding protein, HI0074 n=1 Tax=Acididesulfobacillus acetoxydans TaxID=1561005 RepID=A0A8S0XUW3_9FIRM|nr:nucleotidyltransferase substrate binding protein [Acididesulfobacillus acetoxydans]CAA7599797.1 nucleotidyltransferase substrate binding protein, HI0074 family [Acididesulfobacillus acetoxydans]CEJ07363.1 Nucleotidyltransferase substrate binding protein, HI0074 [Acididesulfobacillus acetoxydans]